jgi:thiaminase (transcriptional activator TenA)
MTDTWTDGLWVDVEWIYAAILTHPFHVGLTSGKLDEACFAYYVAQDVHYLRGYSRVLALVAARAPTQPIAGMFAEHAAGMVAVELSLHDALLPELGLSSAAVDATPRSPTTTAYVNHLLAVGYGGTFAEGLAAVLPCYWIYERVGADLVKQGSPDPRYQRWIDTYAGDEFAAIVDDVIAVADETGQTLSDEEEARARQHFVTSSRFEWMFWDAAYRREAWPV